MKSLKRLNPSQSQDQHTHVAFIDDTRGQGKSSFHIDHAHDLYWVDTQPPQTDPNTGQPAIDPNTGQPAQEIPGHWEMTPGNDGHTHEGFVDIVSNPKELSDKGDTDTVGEVLQLFNAWYETDRLSIEAGRVSEDFYCGKQWSETEKSSLNSQSRACLTINYTEKGIDTLSGFERQQRTDIHYVPVEGTDQKAADLYNILVKSLLDNCKFAQEKSESFEDCAIAGRGCLNIRMNFDTDFRGEVIVERFPWDQALISPHEKRDCSDADGIIKYRWYSLAKAKQLWPDHADDFESLFILPVEAYTDVTSTQPGEQAGIHGTQMSGSELLRAIDQERKNILVVECQRVIYLPVPVLANAQEDFYLNAWGWNPNDIKEALTIQGFVRVDRTIKKIRITKIAGSVLLSDENPADLPSDTFHFIPFYAKRRRGQFWGKVESVKDPQREVNKRASQAIDIGNRMAGYSWYYDKETFPDNELERFKTNSSEPGAVFEVNSTNRLPVKTEGVKFPSEIVQLREMSAADIDKIMNIVPEVGGANTSGSALLQREKAKMTANEYLFDSLTDATVRLGRLLVPIIQKYYPPERIVRIVRGAAKKSPQAVGGEDVNDFSDEEIMTILEQNELEKFDLVVTESSTSPSARLATYLTLTDLAAKGQPIPPELLIKYSDAPQADKDEALKMLQDQQQAQGDQAANQGNAEIEKTLVAKGIIPPTVAERFQIPPQVPLPQQQQGVSPPEMPQSPPQAPTT